MVIKVFVLIKRRAGMPLDEFIDYYENNHAVRAKKAVPNIKKYVRHYLHPFGNEMYAMDEVSAVDVVTEIRFDDQEDFERGMAYLNDPEVQKSIGDKGDSLFERSSIRYYVVEDHESDMTR